MATIGQTLTSPEPGWKRYDDSNELFKYTSNWLTTQNNSSYYMGFSQYTASNDPVNFSFLGSKIRFFSTMANNQGVANVVIDGKLYNYNSYTDGATKYQIFLIEINNLNYGIHQVSLSRQTGQFVSLDAIDIDDNGRILHQQEVLTPYELEVGKRIRCHYTGRSNKFGFFYGLGQANSDFIPVLPPINPDGDFYFIATKKENNKVTLIPDRSIQAGVSYNTLNTEGVVAGKNLKMLSVTENYFTDVATSSSSPFQKVWDIPVYMQELHIVRIDNRADQVMTEVEIYDENNNNIASQAIFQLIGEPSSGTYTESLVKSRMTDGDLSTYAWDDNPNEKGENGIRILFTEAVKIKKLVVYGNNTFPMRTLRLRLLNEGHELPIRFMTGGSSSSSSSEWNQYIVNSNLNNSIVPGDNKIWNWSGRWTMTSTLFPSGNVVVRGNSSANGYGSDVVTKTSTSTTNNNYRPLTEIDISAPPTQGRFDLPASVTIPYNRTSDIAGNIGVNPKGFMPVKVNVTPITKFDLPSSLSINKTDNLPSSLLVSLHGFAPVKVNVIQPPRTTVKLTPVQDAFITTYSPRLNYGNTGDLLIGNSVDANNGLYRSLLQFNTSQISKNMKVTKGIFKIYFDYENLINQSVSVSEIKQSWTELGVTWSNQPLSNESQYEFIAGQKRGYIEVDILESVQNWVYGNLDNNGILLKLSDEQDQVLRRFYARETVNYAPILEVEYYDPTPKSYDYGDLSGLIKINRYNQKDLSSKFQIKALFENNDLQSKIHLTNLNYMLEGSLNVTRDQLLSMIKIKLKSDNDLTGAIIVTQKNLNDLDGTIKINPIYLNSQLKVRRQDESQIDGSLIVKELSKNDLESIINITNPDLVGRINIFKNDSIEGKIDIKYAKNSNLSSYVTVVQHKENDLTGSIEIYQTEILDGIININSGYLASSISVPYREEKDLPVKMNIQTFYVSDLESIISVGKFTDLSSNIEIVLGRPNNFIIYW